MTTKAKEFYSVNEVAGLYGKDASHVRKEIKNLDLETVMVRVAEGGRPIQALSAKAFNKLVTTLEWSDVSVSENDISVVEAMKALGLNVENQRKTFSAKLAELKIVLTKKNVGKGKAQPCFDKKHMKELKDIFVLPVIG